MKQYSQEIVDDIIYHQSIGWSHRAIALAVLGSESKKSTVSSILARNIPEDNSRVLIIPDMHIPYHHPDTIPFLTHLKKKYNPTRIVCAGDELDKHALSYHDHDPDLS